MYASTNDVEQQERATAGIHDRTTCYVKLPRSLARAVTIMVKRLASARFLHRARRPELCTAGPSPHKRSLARRAATITVLNYGYRKASTVAAAACDGVAARGRPRRRLAPRRYDRQPGRPRRPGRACRRC